jgi:hypothetical protein
MRTTIFIILRVEPLAIISFYLLILIVKGMLEKKLSRKFTWFYFHSIYRKLSIKNRVQLANFIRNSIIN